MNKHYVWCLAASVGLVCVSVANDDDSLLTVDNTC